MLNSLDTLIGFVTVILTFSLLVTALTQFVLSAVNLRGRNLRDGLVTLLRQVSPGLDERQARLLASEVLRHPMVSLERSWWSVMESACDLEFRSAAASIRNLTPSCRMGTVIERDELVRVLLELLSTTDRATDPHGVYAELAKTLPIDGSGAAQQTAAGKAAEILKDFRAETVRAEMAQPDIANQARVSEALQRTVGHVWPDFIARVHLWFDQTMDRTTSRFVGRTRLITWALSVVLAAGLEIDAFRIYNKISTDQTARSFFAGRGMAIADTSALSGPFDSSSPRAAPDGMGLKEKAREFNELALQGVIVLPKWFSRNSARAPGAGVATARQSDRNASPAANGGIVSPEDSQRASARTEPGSGRRSPTALLASLIAIVASGLRSALTPGVIAMWILLTFGAPFWFQVLRELVKLRPILAGKEETQRRSRQAAPASLPAASGTSAAAVRAAPAGRTGEAGDLDSADAVG